MHMFVFSSAFKQQIVYFVIYLPSTRFSHFVGCLQTILLLKQISLLAGTASSIKSQTFPLMCFACLYPYPAGGNRLLHADTHWGHLGSQAAESNCSQEYRSTGVTQMSVNNTMLMSVARYSLLHITLSNSLYLHLCHFCCIFFWASVMCY